MRTALLFSGLTRGLSFTHENIKSNIIDNFGDCDIYFYLTEGSNWEEFQQSFKANSEAIKFLKGKVLFGADETPDPSYSSSILDSGKKGTQAISSVYHFYNQWLSVMKCKDFMISSIGSSFSYDYVIRIRPDANFASSVTPDMINLDGISVPTDQSHGGINDRFAISSLDNMVKYCDFFKSQQMLNFPAFSEGKLKSYLNFLKIPIFEIDAVTKVVNPDGCLR